MEGVLLFLVHVAHLVHSICEVFWDSLFLKSLFICLHDVNCAFHLSGVGGAAARRSQEAAEHEPSATTSGAPVRPADADG
jgi:hypothetical protein